MKKLISLVLCLCVACLLVSGTAENAALTGEWYLQTLKMGDEEMNAASIGIVMTLELKEDGSAEMNDMTGTWTAEGEKVTITFEDEAAEAAFTGDTLTLVSEDETMVFTRDRVEQIEVADVNPEAAAEDFAGEWICKYAGSGDMVLNAEALGMGNTTATVADGKLALAGNESFTILFGPDPIEMTYANGSMSYTADIAGISLIMEATLLQDGMLCLTVSMGEETSLYFEKAQ